MYNFMFAAKKDPLPHHMVIGDIYNGDEEELGFNEGGEDALRSFSHSSMTTPRPRQSPGFEKRSNDVIELMSTMRDMAAERNSANETQKEILTLLNKHDRESSNRAEFGRGTMMNDIEQTQWVIHNFEADLATHKVKKQKHVNMIGYNKNNKRIQKMDKAIKSTKSMIKISRASWNVRWMRWAARWKV
jgi:hypothetical protein